MQWIQAISSLGLFIMTIVGVVYAGRQLRALKKSRMAQMIIQLCEYWESPTMVEARAFIYEEISQFTATTDPASKIQELYNSYSQDLQNLHKFLQFGKILNFIHNIAIFADQGLIDVRLIHSVFGAPIENYYKIFKKVISDSPHGQPIQRLIETFAEIGRPKQQRKLPTETSE
ncbi:hypothetical protein HRbin11_01326 [bacterium HR11]|nr:hypothetical protein HRbin11_01326 [bacterium HR11]